MYSNKRKKNKFKNVFYEADELYIQFQNGQTGLLGRNVQSLADKDKQKGPEVVKMVKKATMVVWEKMKKLEVVMNKNVPVGDLLI